MRSTSLTYNLILNNLSAINRRAFITMIILYIVSGLSYTNAQNLLTNPGFENGTTGWNVNTPGGQSTQYLNCGNINGYIGNGGSMTQEYYSVTEDCTYTLNFEAYKHYGNTGWALIELNAYDTDSGSWVSLDAEGVSISLNSWNSYSIDLVAPVGADVIQIYIGAGSGATCRVDCMDLSESCHSTEICNNNIDDDGDGFIDSADVDCAYVCANNILTNEDFENPGSANFNQTFEGQDAYTLIDSDNSTVPGWYLNDASGGNGSKYLIEWNNPTSRTGSYSTYIQGANACMNPRVNSSWQINIAPNSCYEVCLDMAAWSPNSTQSDADMKIEYRWGDNGSSLFYPSSTKIRQYHTAPASTSDNIDNLNWGQYCFRIDDAPESGEVNESGSTPAGDWQYFQLSISSDDNNNGVFIDNVCITEKTCPAGCALTNPYPGFPIDFLNDNTGWIDYDLDADLYLVDNGDGTMTITGTIINGTPVDFGFGINGTSCGATDSWTVSLTLSDKRTWTEWQAMGGFSNLHSNCSSAAPDLDYWDISGTLIGIGCNSGRTITITGPKAPYRLQIGNGANSGDGNCSFGMSTWFDGTEGGSAINSDIYAFLDQACYDAQSTIEICDDNIDNDGDGLVDCDDPYCGGATVVEAGPDKTICNNNTQLLEGSVSGNSSPYTYAWSPTTGLDNPNILMPAASPITTTVYTLTVMGDNGCTTTDVVTVELSDLSADISAAQVMCNGNPTNINLTASGGTPPYTYNWIGPNNYSATSEDISVSDHGTYTVTVTDDNGCTDTDQIDVSNSIDVDVSTPCTILNQNEGFEDSGSTNFSSTYNGLPAALLPRSSTIIPHWTADYSCTAAGPCPDSYWINDQADQVNNPEGDKFVILTQTNYCMRLTIPMIAGECYKLSAFTALYNNGSSIDGELIIEYINNSKLIPLTTEIITSTSNFNNMNWKKVEVTFTPTETKSYSLYFTFKNPSGTLSGGMAMDDIRVTPCCTNICSGNSINLTANSTGGIGALSYNWSTGSTSSSINANPSTSTSYTVTVTDTNGCSATDQIDINVNNNTYVEISTPCTILNQNEGFEDSGSTNFSSTYNGLPAALLPRSSTIIPHWTADYSCTAAGPCPDSYWINDQADQVNNPEGDKFVILTQTNYCMRLTIPMIAGECYKLSAFTALYNNGSSIDGELIIEYINNSKLIPLITENITSTSNFNNMNWKKVEVTFTPTETKSYSLYFTFKNPSGTLSGGMAMDDIRVTPCCTNICSGNSISLTANSTGGTGALSYNWSTGSTSSSISANPSTSTSYTVTVTDTNGCSATDQINVNVNNNTHVEISTACTILNQNESFEDSGSTNFSSTYNGIPAALLPKNSKIIPHWTADFSCTAAGPCPDSYWINDQADQVNNPEGDKFVILTKKNYYMRLTIPLTAGECYKLSAYTALNNDGSSINGEFNIEYLDSNSSLSPLITENITSTSNFNNMNWEKVEVTFTPTQTKSYSLYFTFRNPSGTLSGGMAMDDIRVTPCCTNICSGNSISLTANSTGGTGALSYNWSTGSTSSSIIADPSSSTSYTVTVSDASGCSATDQIDINVINNTNVEISTPCTILNQNESFEDSGSTNFSSTYNGLPAALLPKNSKIIPHWTADFSCTAAGPCPDSYWINDQADQVNNPEGDKFVILTKKNYYMRLTIPMTAGECYKLSAYTALYNDGSSINGDFNIEYLDSNSSLSPLITENITSTSNFNNMNWKKVEVTFTPTQTKSYSLYFTFRNPSGTLSGGMAMDDIRVTPCCTNICSGEAITLFATPIGSEGSVTYNWSTGSTSNSIIASTSESYTVTITDAGGCTATDQISISYSDNYSDGGSISGDESACGSYDPTEIISINAPSGGSGGTTPVYQWQKRTYDCATSQWSAWVDISNTNTATYDPSTITQTTQYRRFSRRTDCFEWVSSDVVTKNISHNVTDPGTISADQSNCGAFVPNLITGTAADVSCSSQSYSYQWQVRYGLSGSFSNISGADTQDYNPPMAYEYTEYRRAVIVQDCNDIYSNIIKIDVTENPFIESEGLTICSGQSITLDPNVCEVYPDITAQRPLINNTGWSNSSISGQSGITGDGILCFTIDELVGNSPQMFGLNNNPASSSSFVDIEYAVYINVRIDIPRYLIQIRENGTSKDNAYNSPNSFEGSTVCIRRTGTLVEYLLDDTVIFTSSAASTGTLYYDHSFHSGGGVWTGGYSKFTDISLCASASSLDLGYQWSNGETTSTIQTSTPGDYSVTTTGYNGCVSSGIISVTTTDLSTYAGAEQEICEGSTANINLTTTGGTPPYTYSWEGPDNYSSNSQNISVSEEGAYTVTVTDGQGCTTSDMVAVQVMDVEPGVIEASGIDCPSNDPGVIINIESPSFCNDIVNHQLDNDLDDWHICSVQSVSTPVTGTLDTNSVLSGKNSAYVEINEVTQHDWHHQVLFRGNELIQGDTYTISFEAKATGPKPVRVMLQLNEAPNTNFFSQTVNLTTTPDSYSLTYTATEDSDNVGLSFNVGSNGEDLWLDNVVFKNNDCSEPSFDYKWECRESDGNGGWTTWTDIPGANSATYDPPVQTTIKQYRRLASSVACNDYSASNAVEIENCPCDITVSATGASICSGDTATLTGSASGGQGTASYQWQSSEGGIVWNDISGANSINYNTQPLSASTYYRLLVTYSNSPCDPTSSDAAFVEVELQSIPVSISADPENICNNESTTLSINENITTGGMIDYTSWTTGTGNIGSFNVNGSASENHRVMGKDPWGNDVVVWEARPDANSNADGGFYTDRISIDHDQMYRFSVWVNRKVIGSNGRFYLGPNGYGSTNGVKTRSNGNTSTNPYFYYSNPPTAMPEDEWMLVVGHVYPSSDNGTNNHPDSGLYTTSEGNIGNTYNDYQWLPQSIETILRTYLFYTTDTDVRQQWIYPRVDIIDGTEPSVDDLLNGFDVNGGLGTGAQWTWYEGSCGGTQIGTGNSITVNPSTTTTYYIRGEGTCGNTECEEITITISDIQATASNDGPLTCSTNSVTIIAEPSGMTYEWTDGETTQTITTNNPGTYTVTVTDNNGCTATAETIVVENTTEPVVDVGDDVSVCSGESIELNQLNIYVDGNSYQWSPTTGLSDPNISNPIATPSVTTTYTLTVTGENGCTASEDVIVSVTDPNTDIIPPDSDCSGLSSVYESGEISGAKYMWDFAGATTVDNDYNDRLEEVIWPSTFADTTVTVTLTVTTSDGCVSTATESVTIYALPEDDIQGDMFVRENSSNRTYEGPAANSYAWSVIDGDALIIGANTGPTCVIDFFTENSTLQLIVNNNVGCPDTLYQYVGMLNLAQCNYYDNFDQVSYNNSHGTQDWSSESWLEYNDNNDPNSGDIRLNGRKLRLQNSPGAPTVYIERNVNLLNIDNARLSFDFRTSNWVESGDIFEVEIYDGNSWSTLYSLNGQRPNGFFPDIDISAYANADTRIRFSVTNGYTGFRERIRIDDVAIYGDCNLCAFENLGLESENTCEGACEGIIFIDPDYPVTGDFDLSYDYNGSTINLGPYTTGDTVFITGLCVGTYSNITIARVDDQCSEVWPQSLTIGETGAEWEHVTHTDDVDNCDGICNGSFTVDANHGLTGEFTVSYTYEGTITTLGPYDFAGDLLIDDLCPGTYSDITITGIETGCSDIWPDDIEIVIERPEASVVSYEDDNCQEEEGATTLQISGGSTPYSITWHSQDGTITGSTTLNHSGQIEIEDLAGGHTYCITVTDSNGCTND